LLPERDALRSASCSLGKLGKAWGFTPEEKWNNGMVE